MKKVMGFYDVFMDNSWSHYLGFYCSLSEAQKGAEDRGQIKALVGGLPVTSAELPLRVCLKFENFLWGMVGVLGVLY